MSDLSLTDSSAEWTEGSDITGDPIPTKAEFLKSKLKRYERDLRRELQQHRTLAISYLAAVDAATEFYDENRGREHSTVLKGFQECCDRIQKMKWHSETVFDKMELLVPMHDPDDNEYSDKWVITEDCMRRWASLRDMVQNGGWEAMYFDGYKSGIAGESDDGTSTEEEASFVGSKGIVSDESEGGEAPAKGGK